MKGNHEQRSDRALILQSEPSTLPFESVNKDKEEFLVHDQRLERLEKLYDLILVRLLGQLQWEEHGVIATRLREEESHREGTEVAIWEVGI